MGFFDWVRGKVGKPTTRDNFAGTYGIGAGGGFAGAAVNRLTDSLTTWSGSINSDLDGNNVILRARARQLCADNEYGRRFLNLVATNIVGRSGPKLQVRAYKDQRNPNAPTVLDKSANDTVEVHYERWGKRADIGGRMALPHLFRVVAKAVARDGESLVRIVRDRKLPYGIALQVLEADRLDETLNVTQGNTNIRQGVEIDGSGRALAIWIKTKHPGDRYAITGRNEIERIPVADIIHAYLPERAEQVRGYTWFHAILRRAHQLHGFNDAAVTAARVGASKIAALERSDESGDLTASIADGQIGGAFQMNVEAGEMFELPPGYKLSSWNPDYPHANFESFVKAAMRGISSGLDVATHNLSGDMTDVNYSSARIAELAEREQWMVLQDWFIATLVEPIYQEWLASAMLRGDITFEISGKPLPADKLAKFSGASRFQGRRWRWVDPAKELKAAVDGVALGIVSRTRLAAEQGDDIDDIFDELAQEQAAMDASGLLPVAPPPTIPDSTPEVMAAKALADGQVRVAEINKEARVATALPPHPPAPPPAALQPIAIAVDTTGMVRELAQQSAMLAEKFARLQEGIDAMQVNVAAPEVTVNVAAPNVTVSAPEVTATFEAIMPERSEIVISQLPTRKTTTEIQRDAAGNITASIQTEADA